MKMHLRLVLLLTLLLLSLACGWAAPPAANPPAPTTAALTPAASLAAPTPTPPPASPLLAALALALNEEQAAWERYDYGSFQGDFLTSANARAVLGYAQFALDARFPSGFPFAADALAAQPLPPIWLPPSPAWRLWQAALAQSIPGPLTAGAAFDLLSFTLTPLPLELDGDARPEWLLEASSPSQNLHGWLPLDEVEAGVYRWLPNTLPHANHIRAPGAALTPLPDQNSDGLTDLLYTFDSRLFGGQRETVAVFSLQNGRLDALPGLPTLTSQDWLVDPAQSRGIQILSRHTLNFGCDWESAAAYRWQGTTLVQTVDQPNPPETPLCAAAEALNPHSELLPAERAAALEAALAYRLGASLAAPFNDSDYHTLLAVHYAAALAAQAPPAATAPLVATDLPVAADPLAAALLELDAILSAPSDTINGYTQITRAAWLTALTQFSPAQSPRPFFSHFCALLAQPNHLAELATTPSGPYFSFSALYLAYGAAGESLATELLCPLAAASRQRLLTLALPAENALHPLNWDPAALAAALTAAGLPVAQVERLSAPFSAAPLALLVTAAQTPALVLLETTTTSGALAWRAAVLTDLPAAPDTLQAWSAGPSAAPQQSALLLTFNWQLPANTYAQCSLAGQSGPVALALLLQPEVAFAPGALRAGAPGWDILKEQPLCAPPFQTAPTTAGAATPTPAPPPTFSQALQALFPTPLPPSPTGPTNAAGERSFDHFLAALDTEAQRLAATPDAAAVTALSTQVSAALAQVAAAQNQLNTALGGQPANADELALSRSLENYTEHLEFLTAWLSCPAAIQSGAACPALQTLAAQRPTSPWGALAAFFGGTE